MSTASAAPTGVGGGVGLDQAVMPAGDMSMMPATQGAIGVPTDASLATAMKGIQNMLGKTPEERERNAKALAAGVKDINSLVGSISETTLLQRMMEAQGSGLGFVSGNPGSAVAEIPRSFTPASASPIVSQLGFK